MHQAGIPTDEAVGQAATMPHQGGAALHQWLQSVAGSTMKAGDFLPQTSFVNTGGSVQGVDTNPITNPNAPSTSLPATLSPGEQTQPVTGPPTASGAPTTIPAAQFAAQHGLGGLIPSTGRAPLPSSLVGPGGAPNGPQGGGMPQNTEQSPQAGQSPFGNGGAWGADPSSSSQPSAWGGSNPASSRQPAAAQSPFGGGGAWNGADASNGGQPSGAQSPFGAPTQTGLGPGQKVGIEAGANASASQWADLQHQVGGTSAGGGSAGRIYQLQQSLKSLQQLGPQGTGPGAAGMQSVIRYAQSMPFVGGLVSGVTSPDQIANYDEANKYLTQYASAKAGAHGGTTDSQLATALSGNASTHISNLAAQNVVKANIGLERMDQAQAQAFQQTGQTPDQFSNFSAGWNRSMDPRAFIADQLTPQQLQSTVSSMSPANRTKFQSTYNQAVTNGWMNPPAWAQSGSGNAQASPSGGSSNGY